MWEAELGNRLEQAGYPVMMRASGCTLIKHVDGLPKPSKIVGKYFHELRQLIEPHYITRPFDRTAMGYAYGADAVMSGETEKLVLGGIKKTKVSDCVLHFSRQWFSEDGIYGDAGSCFYPGRDYGHCSDGIIDNGGLVVRVIHPDYASLAESSYVDDDAIDEAGAALGRCWLMPCDNVDGVVVCNSYNKTGHGWLNREVIANCLRDHIVEKFGCDWQVVKAESGEACGWYVNGSSGFVVSSHTPRYFDLPDIEEDKSVECDCCGDRFDDDELESVASGERVCSSCLSDSYFLCEVCEEYHPTDEMQTVYDWSDGMERYVCDCCISNDSDIQMVPDWIGGSEGIHYVDMSR
jgi:hypothetical protein